jgi:hypothetical protein
MPHAALRALVGLALTAVVLTSCSEDGGSTTSPDGSTPSHNTTESPTAPTEDALVRAAQACTDVVNDRDARAWDAGRAASLEILAQHLADPRRAPDDVDVLRARAEALRDQLSDARDRLEEVEGVDDWDGLVLAPLHADLEALDARIAAATIEAWPDAVLAADPGTPASTDALAEAGLLGRDCEVLTSTPGPLPEAPDFAAAAADTCRAVVDRRRLGDFTAARDRVVEAVADVLQDGEVSDGDDVAEALTVVEAEWRTTYDDLAAVPTADLPRGALSQAWAAALQLADDRAAGYARRAEALEAGDDAAIGEAFQPGALGAPGWEWESLGLDRRDCRTIEP